jgi:hypothetical protein
MLRWDDPEATLAEGTLTEIKAGPLPALVLKRERDAIYQERSRLTPLNAGWLRRALILTIPTGLASRLPPVSA